MSRASPITLIEATYTAHPSESVWLDHLAAASAGYDLGRGVLAWTVDLGGPPKVRTMVARGAAESLVDPIRRFVSRLSPEIARGVFAPTEFVGNASWRINRLAASLDKNQELARAAFFPPLWVLIGGDGQSGALALAFQGGPDDFAPDLAFPHEHRGALGLVAAHFGAALRLRSELPAANDTQVEAVLDPRGVVLHAEGEGTGASARQSLSEAVVRAERARGALRATDEAGAAELWQALVAGRWSIVESIDRDGKRLLLARANPLGTPERTSLSETENDVVSLAAFGHSYKFIAYELGFDVSTVVRRLKSAMKKLGVSDRRELLRKLGQ